MNIGVIDIETTEFFENGGFIVEVGIARLDLSDGSVTEVYESVCRESGMTAKHRKAWIFDNSNLIVEEVRSAPDLSEILPEIQKHIDSFDAMTAYNKDFDFTFLRDRGIIIKKEWPCPMQVATRLCKLRRYNGDYKWPKVEEAWEHFFPNEPYIEAHRGLDDAMHEARIVYELFKLGLMTDEIQKP